MHLQSIIKTLETRATPYVSVGLSNHVSLKHFKSAKFVSEVTWDPRADETQYTEYLFRHIDEILKMIPPSIEAHIKGLTRYDEVKIHECNDRLYIFFRVFYKP